jgi:hypothetical protein
MKISSSWEKRGERGKIIVMNKLPPTPIHAALINIDPS